MPIPKPRKNEEKDKFISRCAADPTMNKEFPKNNVRLGLCFSQYRQAKKRQRAKGSKEEPTWEEYSGEYLGDGYTLI